jgi:elongation factor Tu
MNRPADATAEFRLLPTESGGKAQAVSSGYRPTVGVHSNYQTSVSLEFEASGLCAPGASVHASVWFLTPEVYPHSLWAGRELEVFEGSRRVGTLQIRSVLNPVLVGRAEAFSQVWVAPVNPRGVPGA